MKKNTPGNELYILIIGASIVSFSSVFIKILTLSPSIIGFYRMLFGGIILLIISLIRKEKFFNGLIPYVYTFLCGLTFALDLTLWHRSVHYIGPGIATLLPNMQVIIVAISGILLFKEKLNWRLIISIPLALFGLYLLCGINISSRDSDYIKGVIYGILAIFCYASFIIFLKMSQIREKKLNPFPNMVIICFFSLFFLGLESVIRGNSFILTNRHDLGITFLYGSICQGFGWILISISISKIEAGKTGLILLAQPALSFLWDILFFHKKFIYHEIIGVVIIFIAIYLGSLKYKEKLEIKNT